MDIAPDSSDEMVKVQPPRKPSRIGIVVRGLLRIVIVLAVFVGLVLGLSMLVLPPNTIVERNMTVLAPPDKVFAVVGHLHRLGEWMAWTGNDQVATLSFEGPESGAGQTARWVLTDVPSDSGSIRIVEVTDNARLAGEIDLAGAGKAQFWLSLVAVAGGTSVTWHYEKEHEGLAARFAGLSYDGWIGAAMVRGLAKLKRKVEADNPPAG